MLIIWGFLIDISIILVFYMKARSKYIFYHMTINIVCFIGSLTLETLMLKKSIFLLIKRLGSNF